MAKGTIVVGFAVLLVFSEAFEDTRNVAAMKLSPAPRTHGPPVR